MEALETKNPNTLKPRMDLISVQAIIRLLQRQDDYPLVSQTFRIGQGKAPSLSDAASFHVLQAAILLPQTPLKLNFDMEAGTMMMTLCDKILKVEWIFMEPLLPWHTIRIIVTKIGLTPSQSSSESSTEGVLMAS